MSVQIAIQPVKQVGAQFQTQFNQISPGRVGPQRLQYLEKFHRMAVIPAIWF